jgi:delta24-sterol reductase
MDDFHQDTVKDICERVRHFHDSKTKFRVYHGSTNSTRQANFDRDAIVDVSMLNRILSISPETRTALVEPNVPMDALVKETKKYGLLPPVVMEFPGITVGGGVVGTAGESSSFKHGFFDRCVEEVHVVMADGKLVTAGEGKNEELLEALRGSFGTLGVLTLVKLRLIDARKYVEVTYHPTSNIKQAVQMVNEEAQNQEHDYIDGILFSRTSGVIVTGRLTDSPSLSTDSSSASKIVRFSRPWDEWFYLHAGHIAASQQTKTEYVPLEDYLFRYDRGAFWTGMYAFKWFMLPFNWLMRLLLDYFMHTRIMYHALHESGHTDRYIIQDLALPGEHAAEFVEWVDERFGIYPLWVCPLRGDARHSMGYARDWKSKAGKDDDVYVNIGVWGPYPGSEAGYVSANRALEGKLAMLGGLKWLYARVFCTEDEFWDIYDKQRYEEVRRRFNATGLPSIWEKVREDGKKRGQADGGGLRDMLRRLVKSNSFLSGFYGVWKAVRGGDYLLAKKRR